MVEKSIEVKLKAGLQARAASIFVQEASRYSSEIFLERDGRKVNAKSIMGLMSLAIGPETVINLSADGEDEEEAIAALSKLIENEN
ncbi:MAG TPA: HPr family phosphocarrier protein [Bacillaceae bacterium]|nr:HPr family phosphocarrier protein [Paenibacillus bovis]HLU23026.1 HPr family phosphocarrier protein [Bacillaceae bacterium]